MTDDAIRAAAERLVIGGYRVTVRNLSGSNDAELMASDRYKVANAYLAHLDRPPVADDATWAREFVERWWMTFAVSTGPSRDDKRLMTAELLARLSRGGAAAKGE